MIVFNFITKINEPGGVQTLILNLTKYLNKQGIKVKLIDKKTGYLYNYFKLNKYYFEFIDYDEQNFKDKIKDDDIFISFGRFYNDLTILKHKFTRVIYWSVFEDELINIFKLRKSIINVKFSNNNILSRFLTKKFLNITLKKKSLFLMSKSILDIIQKNKFICSPDYDIYLPIPIEVKKFNYFLNLRRNDNKIIHIACIARAEVWKYYSIKRFLYDLNTLNLPIKVTIITDKKEFYIERIKNLDISKNIFIEYLENLNSNQLHNFLIKKIDLVYAMGTSILEGARLGIPSLIADPYYEDLPDNYKYHWLYEATGYNLCNALWAKETLNGWNIQEIFNQIKDENRLKLISEKCFQHVKKYHDLNWVGSKFLEAIELTELRFEDLKWMYSFLVKRKFLNSFIKNIIKQ